jgi:hypothetical protein
MRVRNGSAVLARQEHSGVELEVFQVCFVLSADFLYTCSEAEWKPICGRMGIFGRNR